MTQNRTHTSKECIEFQDQLPEFFESDADLLEHPHLKTCENCSALVRDLEYIAAQAKLLLPIHDPSPAVWENIHNALARNAKNGEENS
ncbi:MAG: hypothetical protein WA708_12360 [Acidobacteriaceae bacterium]|jgi:hypothetical protein